MKGAFFAPAALGLYIPKTPSAEGARASAFLFSHAGRWPVCIWFCISFAKSALSALGVFGVQRPRAAGAKSAPFTLGYEERANGPWFSLCKLQSSAYLFSHVGRWLTVYRV